jgi:hypothetical protein
MSCPVTVYAGIPKEPIRYPAANRGVPSTATLLAIARPVRSVTSLKRTLRIFRAMSVAIQTPRICLDDATAQSMLRDDRITDQCHPSVLSIRHENERLGHPNATESALGLRGFSRCREDQQREKKRTCHRALPETLTWQHSTSASVLNHCVSIALLAFPLTQRSAPAVRTFSRTSPAGTAQRFGTHDVAAQWLQ